MLNACLQRNCTNCTTQNTIRPNVLELPYVMSLRRYERGRVSRRVGMSVSVSVCLQVSFHVNSVWFCCFGRQSSVFVRLLCSFYRYQCVMLNQVSFSLVYTDSSSSVLSCSLVRMCVVMHSHLQMSVSLILQLRGFTPCICSDECISSVGKGTSINQDRSINGKTVSICQFFSNLFDYRSHIALLYLS